MFYIFTLIMWGFDAFSGLVLLSLWLLHAMDSE